MEYLYCLLDANTILRMCDQSITRCLLKSVYYRTLSIIAIYNHIV